MESNGSVFFCVPDGRYGEREKGMGWDGMGWDGMGIGRVKRIFVWHFLLYLRRRLAAQPGYPLLVCTFVFLDFST
jgi:hypothetical protein